MGGRNCRGSGKEHVAGGLVVVVGIVGFVLFVKMFVGIGLGGVGRRTFRGLDVGMVVVRLRRIVRGRRGRGIVLRGGRAVLRRLRGFRGRLSVIVVTGWVRKAARRLGALVGTGTVGRAGMRVVGIEKRRAWALMRGRRRGARMGAGEAGRGS